ncbi:MULTISPECIES: hypothetical protein [Mycolicibacter]|uniref:Uncharacterized protein n=1 Tax=Mycolicibacter longobardus TaxID=1108812 RepID=A0A1X1YA98_9MYCO|nr:MULTISPECIES: hypothetical protein [Mycolicibacter]ORW08018.1 hypothetical protein AWC16_19970 [Mycolicibacter longobardus]RAV04331.1 hypothetical protein DQP56_00495 [Mycolicibacter senuensis]
MASKMKGVFSSQLDGDLDDLLPKIPVPTAAAKPAAANKPAEAAPTPSTPTEAAPSAPVAPAATTGGVQRPRRRRATGSTPTAEVAPEVYKALRRFTSREKARDPITARKYAEVVLDAIEHSQEELSTFWKQPEAAAAGGGLFSRQPAAPVRRRRHSEPPGRVPLTGLNPADAAILENLIEEWQAPSRSALVEQALRLYEPLWPAARRSRRGAAADGDDDLDDESSLVSA